MFFSKRKHQKGFLGGAYVALSVLMLAMLGTLITISAGTSKKINTTQVYLKSAKISDKLARYIITKTARDEDNDGVFELPYQYNLYASTDGQPSLTMPSPLSSNMPSGYPLNSVNVNGVLTNNAQGKPFHICSVDLSKDGIAQHISSSPPNRIAGPNRPLTDDQLMERPVFAIVDIGPNGQIETTCAQALNGDFVSDDRVRVITYGEVFKGRDQKRMSMFKNEIPECTATQTLALRILPNTNDPAQPTYEWYCQESAMPFAAQNLPQCADNQRLTLNLDGLFSCTNVSRLADGLPQEVDTAKATAGICGVHGRMTSYDRLDNGRHYLNCTYTDSNYMATHNLTDPRYQTYFSQAALTAEPSCNSLITEHVKAILYRGTDGRLRCSKRGTPSINIGSLNNLDILIIDKGIVSGFNIFSAAETPQANSATPCANDQTVEIKTGSEFGLECAAAQNSVAYVIPNNDGPVTCPVRSLIIFQGGIARCVTGQQYLSMITPPVSCTTGQIVSWNYDQQRFKCIPR